MLVKKVYMLIFFTGCLTAIVWASMFIRSDKMQIKPMDQKDDNTWANMFIRFDQTDLNTTTVYFTDTHEVIYGNPYRGIAFDINTVGYKFTNDPAVIDLIDGVRSIPEDADIVRALITWADFEPDDNQWDWGIIDRFLDKIHEQGKTAEIQLLMSEAPASGDSGFPFEYPPAWLFDVKNCSYRMAPYGDGTFSAKQPIYYDPIYLSELEEAISAFADHYDGHPGIAWVDLRAFSLFGEWSGWNDGEQFPWPDAETRTNTLRKIIDIYKNAFLNTMVMMQNAGAIVDHNDPEADTQSKRYSAFAFDYAAANPFWGFRSDTVTSAGNWAGYSKKTQAQWVNKKTRRDHIQVAEGSNWNNNDIMLNNPRKVVQNAMEDYHANLQALNNVSFHDWEAMKNAYGEWFTTLGRYVGYRFLLAKATYSTKVQPGGDFTLSQTWTNNGVGFSPKQYPLKVYFTDQSTGSIVWSGIDNNFDQRKWFKGDFYDVNSSFTLPADLQFGTYDLLIAMIDSSGNPSIRLPMPDESEKMYKIGVITVASTANPYTAPEPRAQFRIDAENYTDVNGTYGVRYTPDDGKDALYMDRKGDWAEYDNIDVPISGMYTVEFRVSTEEANYFRLEIDGVDVTDSMKTPDSGGYLKFRNMERQVYLTAGRHTFKIVRESIDRWFFLNWMRFTLQHPYNFTIQAENPDHSSDVSLNATKFTDNDGTAGVSAINTGDWLQYDNIHVPESGPYLLQMRYATPAGSPEQKFKLIVNEDDVSGELILYDTGGTNNMASQDYIVNLPAGTHSFKVLWTDVQSQVIWNWMKLSYQGPFTKTIEAEHYTMQWNIDKEDEWEGTNTGVVMETFQEGEEQSLTAVRSLHQNDYMRYDNIYVPYTGHYLFEFRVSASAKQRFRFEADGESTLIEVSDTGGDSQFTTVSTWIKLTEGINNFRIVSEDLPVGSGLCFDWFRFTK